MSVPKRKKEKEKTEIECLIIWDSFAVSFCNFIGSSLEIECILLGVKIEF